MPKSQILEGGHSCTHFWPWQSSGVNGQLDTPAALCPWKEPYYPLNRTLGGPKSQAGHRGMVSIFYVTGIKPWSLKCPTCSLVTILSSLSQLLYVYKYTYKNWKIHVKTMDEAYDLSLFGVSLGKWQEHALSSTIILEVAEIPYSLNIFLCRFRSILLFYVHTHTCHVPLFHY